MNKNMNKGKKEKESSVFFFNTALVFICIEGFDQSEL